MSSSSSLSNATDAFRSFLRDDYLTFGGSMIDVRLVQPRLKSSGSFFTAVSELMPSDVNWVQSLRFASPSSSTFGGSMIDVRLVQPLMKSSGSFFTAVSELMSSDVN